MSEKENTIGELPWIEKYRPHTLTDVIGQEEITKRLSAYAKAKNMPHLLFSGPAGVGKTSSSVALAKELFGPSYERNFLELNASDSRGIDVVRGTIKDFARTLAFDSNFKIIFLDESDALTADAQQALRRTMEKFTKTCRFILSCVTPDTKITLPNETEITIGEFVEKFEQKKQFEILNIDEAQRIEKNDSVICTIEQNPQTTGKRVFELETNTGRTLKLTEDHLLLTESGWKQAGQISMGEKIVVFPSLEGTAIPDDSRHLIDKTAFGEFIKKTELENNYKPLTEAKTFRELCTQDKHRIIESIKKLACIVRNGAGLTPTENRLFQHILKCPNSSRLELQTRMQLSRIRTGELLHAIEKKGFLVRSRKGKMAHFAANGMPFALRNYRDIQNQIQQEFKIRISYAGIKKITKNKEHHPQGLHEKTIRELEKKEMFSITRDSPKAAAIIRLLGFIFGDGHITKSRQRIIFTGNIETLKEVKKDLELLGFDSSQIQHKLINNTIGNRKFTGTTTCFYVDSRALEKTLEFLGAPRGDKIITAYELPKTVQTGNRLQKREFLRALFGCEGYSPKIDQKNFEAIPMRMHKATELHDNMLRFFTDLQNLLKEFDVDSTVSVEQLDYTRKDGKKPECFCLSPLPNNQNLFRFFSRIGYAYETTKMNKARLASEYLRHKQHVLNQQKQKAQQIITALGSGKTTGELAREFGCTPDFVASQAKKKPVHLPRKGFPSFIDWKEKNQYENGLVFNEVIRLQQVCAPKVIDLTCLSNHNFIANGIISHNCNYSSRIIEPIQSRCVVFRFRPLTPKDIDNALYPIAKKEGIELNEKTLKAINYVSQGDLRKAINVLQAAGASGKKLTEENVYAVSSRARPEELQQMIRLALDAKFMDAREKLDQLLFEHGMSGEDVITQMYREIMDMEEKEIPSHTKIELVDIIGEYNFRLVEGANERLQLEALLAQFGKFKHAHEKD